MADSEIVDFGSEKEQRIGTTSGNHLIAKLAAIAWKKCASRISIRKSFIVIYVPKTVVVHRFRAWTTPGSV